MTDPRHLIQDKNEAYKCYKSSNNNSQHPENLLSLRSLLGVEASEQSYPLLLKKLMDPFTSPKTYWSVLKPFHNS